MKRLPRCSITCREESLLVLDESHVMIPQLGAMYKGDRSRKENLVMYGFRLPSALDNRPLKFEEWEARAPQTIFCSATPRPYELELSGRRGGAGGRPTGLIDPAVEVRPVETRWMTCCRRSASALRWVTACW